MDLTCLQSFSLPVLTNVQPFLLPQDVYLLKAVRVVVRGLSRQIILGTKLSAKHQFYLTVILALHRVRSKLCSAVR